LPKVSKYLGLTITNKLQWDQHINNITAKANTGTTLGFLRRDLKIPSIRIKEQAYPTLVRPVMDTSSLSILYIIISLASFLLFAKGLHLSLWSMLLKLDRFLWLLTTYLAALYLGLTITNKLQWDQHINNITAKANKTLGFLRRNLKIPLIRIKEQAYQTLVFVYFCFRIRIPNSTGIFNQRANKRLVGLFFNPD
jgi:hypothetical protein